MFLKKMKIQTKLLIGFAINIFIALVIGTTGYYSLNKVVSVAGLEAKIYELELAFEIILVNQEKYKHTGGLDDFNTLKDTLSDIKNRVDKLRKLDLDKGVIANLNQRIKSYQDDLLSLKKNKDTNHRLFKELNKSSKDMRESVAKEISIENSKIQSNIIGLSRTFIKDLSYENVNQLVELGYNIAKHYHRSGRSKNRALRTLRNVHFDVNNYFFVVKSNYKLVAHGARSELEGIDFSKIKDKKTGKAFMIELVDNAVKNGRSITSYHWTRAGKGDELFPKVSMARYFKPWDLIVCAGVYLEDIDRASKEIEKIVSKGLKDIDILNNLEQTMISAKLEALNHMKFNSGKEKTIELMSKVVDDDAATKEIKKAGKNYINSWKLYSDNLERDENIANDVTQSVISGIDVMEDLTLKIKSVMSRTESSGNSFILWFILLGCCLTILMGFFIIRSIIVPIKKTDLMIKNIAEGEGDLTKRLYENSYDEIGELAKGINKFMEKLQNMIKDISLMMVSLSKASKDLTIVSDEIASSSNQAAEKSINLAGESEEMTSNMNSIATTSQETDSNIQSIVTAIEEMRVTIEDISENIIKGNKITQNAVFHAKDVSSKVDQLGGAAQEISKVTESISDISDQTNLLALNATIEAARAGEAGKGFAVVAGEIKALAEQTAVATNEINSKIGNVQKTTVKSVEVIEDVVSIINDIDEIVSAVSVAIEEQSQTTLEISENVNQAAAGVGDVSGNVVQTNIVAKNVTKEISEVSVASSKINTGSNQVKAKASDLLEIASKLNEMVGKFKV